MKKNEIEHLKPETRRWVRAVDAEYALEAHHQKLLLLAAVSWDQHVDAMQAISVHGTVFQDDRGNPRPRPEVKIANDARISFARIVRELNLDSTPGDSRPPRIGGQA